MCEARHHQSAQLCSCQNDALAPWQLAGRMHCSQHTQRKLRQEAEGQVQRAEYDLVNSGS